MNRQCLLKKIYTRDASGRLQSTGSRILTNKGKAYPPAGPDSREAKRRRKQTAARQEAAR